MPINQESHSSITVPAAANMINIISGLYAAPFGDTLYESLGSLDLVQHVLSAIRALQDSGKSDVAFSLILALYELVSLDPPLAISALEAYPGAIDIFISEFLTDAGDLMYDYEAGLETNDAEE